MYLFARILIVNKLGKMAGKLFVIARVIRLNICGLYSMSVSRDKEIGV